MNRLLILTILLQCIFWLKEIHVNRFNGNVFTLKFRTHILLFRQSGKQIVIALKKDDDSCRFTIRSGKKKTWTGNEHTSRPPLLLSNFFLVLHHFTWWWCCMIQHPFYTTENNIFKFIEYIAMHCISLFEYFHVGIVICDDNDDRITKSYYGIADFCIILMFFLDFLTTDKHITIFIILNILYFVVYVYWRGCMFCQWVDNNRTKTGSLSTFYKYLIRKFVFFFRLFFSSFTSMETVVNQFLFLLCDRSFTQIA